MEADTSHMTADRPPRKVAGFWRRLVADLLDALVLGIIGYAIAFPLRYAFSAMGIHALWIGLACSFLYFGILHTQVGGGQTPGKRVLGIQVLRRDGGFLNFGNSLIRYMAVSFILYNGLYGSLLALLPGKVSMVIGPPFLLVVVWAFFACFILIPLHPLKRGLHDLMAGSVVVHKGAYDAAALDQMENPARTRRALLTLSGVTLAIVGLLVVGVFALKSREIDELSTLYGTLGHDYDVRGVRSFSFNGQQPILIVEVFLPMVRYDDKADRERVRGQVSRKVQESFPNLGRYRELRVITLSGFNIGIASLNLSDG